MAISGLVTNNRGFLTHAFTFMGGDIHTVVTANRGQSVKNKADPKRAGPKVKRAAGEEEEDEPSESEESDGKKKGESDGDARRAEASKMTFAQFASEMQTVTRVDGCLGLGMTSIL